MTNKETKELYDKMMSMSCSFDQELVRKHSDILALIPSIKDDLKQIKEDLSGKDGVLTRHAVLNQEFNNHVKGHSSTSATGKWFIGLVVVILLTLFTSCVNIYVAYDNKVLEQKLEHIEKVIKSNEDDRKSDVADRIDDNS